MDFNDLKHSTENIIEFKDVKFQYVNPGPTVLDIEKLVVKKGERIAIIGPSGSGKTTMRLASEQRFADRTTDTIRAATSCAADRPPNANSIEERSSRIKSGFVV